MKYVMILVEGQTEESFVNKVLKPHFEDLEIYLDVTMVCTKHTKGARNHRGGVNNYLHVNNDLKRLLRSSHYNLVTTFLDYYALPLDFPGQVNKPTINAYSIVNHLEQEFYNDIGNHKFKPFIMLHEFEAMLFCDIYKLSPYFDTGNLDVLNTVNEQFESPELINNSPETAPSKRILKELPGYKKTLHGPIATESIGLDVIRENCSHFDSWITYIENI
ncbi:MAG: DUF4276 family protein [Psychrobacillus sp.]